MKRLIACASLAAVATSAAVVPVDAHQSGTHPAAHAAPHKAVAHKTVAHKQVCKVAPADEYFGKLKMSILGIRNTIKDQGLRVDVDPDKAPSTLGSMALTEDAMHDWQHKYPCDSWIPGTIYALQHFYGKIHTREGVKHVHATFAWLRHDFPRNGLVSVALKENGEATDAPPAPPVTVGAGNDPSAPVLAAPGAPAPSPGPGPSRRP